MQYQPPSKVRSLGILSALTTIKSFDHKQSDEIRCNHLQSGPMCYDMSYSDDDSDWVHASVSEDAMHACVSPAP